jgi:hypothetical protein
VLQVIAILLLLLILLLILLILLLILFLVLVALRVDVGGVTAGTGVSVRVLDVGGWVSWREQAHPARAP